jgi:glutaredoxin 3
MIEVIVYGKESCPQCVTAKNLMEQIKTASCVYKKLGVDFTKEELFAIFPDAKTFPQIKINGELGSLQELQSLAKAQV